MGRLCPVLNLEHVIFDTISQAVRVRTGILRAMEQLNTR